MPQNISQTTVNNFSKGLITEASPLTFPEDASVDLLNCELSRTGVTRRRKGLEYEDSYSLSDYTITSTDLVHSITWSNVSNQSGVEFEVIQVGSILYFYDKSSVPVSGNQKSFTIDLSNFYAGNGENVSTSRISGSSIQGAFVVVSKAVDQFYIEYDPDTDTISTTKFTPQVRDFEWQGDTSEYFEDSALVATSDERIYDTYNSGWIREQPFPTDPEQVITKFKRRGLYPALNLAWFSGKAADGEFSLTAWRAIGAGNSLSGNGHFILDLFNKDRTMAMSEHPNTDDSISLPVETESSRFTATATFAGRGWFTGLEGRKNNSKLFFSPVIQNITDIGKFYQEADPTSEDISDLIDSDGGVMTIHEAYNIKTIFPWKNKLVVVAENGVWVVGGVDDVFKATEFSVVKVVGADGIINKETLIDAEGTPIWWGKTGIYVLGVGEDGFSIVARDISKGTIQTFWEDITTEKRFYATSVYDSLNKRVFWLYGDTDVTVDQKYNKVLILDLVLNAFYPWKFTDEDAPSSYIVGAFSSTGLGVIEETFNVVANGDNVVANGNNVVATITEFVKDIDPNVRFIVRDGSTGKLTFATLTNTDFLDWGTKDYSTYIEAGYIFDGDASLRKNGIYVTTYFDITETGFTGDEVLGYDLVNPSSCLLKAYWDLKVANSSSQQVYRFLRPIVVDTGDLNNFNYPYESVVTRNRIKGRGRVLKLRFESETGKDFQLQGYEVLNAKNTRL